MANSVETTPLTAEIGPIATTSYLNPEVALMPRAICRPSVVAATDARQRRKMGGLAMPATEPCALCGKAFTQGGRGPRTKTCSRKCLDILASVGLICQHCGKTFNGKFRLQKHCSSACRRLARGLPATKVCSLCGKQMDTQTQNKTCLDCRKYGRQRECDQCGNMYTYWLPNSRFCSGNCKARFKYYSRSGRPAICGNCNIAFRPKTNKYSTYCSRECAFEMKTKISRERAWIKAMAKAAKVPFKPFTCKVCGNEWLALRRGISVCDQQECLDQVRQETLEDGREKYRAFYVRAPFLDSCKECGEEISEQRQGLNVRLCERCTVAQASAGRDRHKAMRRVRMRSGIYEVFDSYEVFSRDGWKCQGCGIETLRAYDRSTPEALNISPTLDHIIPLSRGGNHTRDNTQLLCNQCNYTKGDSIEFCEASA